MNAIASWLALSLCLTSSVRAMEACRFERIKEVKESAFRNFDARFNLEDNIQINIDKLVTQVELRELLECVFRTNKAREKVESFVGPVSFGQEVYQMYGNDYSFGVVGSKNADAGTKIIAKMTAKITSDGAGEIFDVLVLEKARNGLKWFRLENEGFVRKDAYCLECHSKRSRNGFVYGTSVYKIVK